MLIKDIAAELNITKENAIVGLIFDTFPELEAEPLAFDYDLNDDLAERLLAAHENLRNGYKPKTQPAPSTLSPPALKGTEDPLSPLLLHFDNQEVDIAIRLANSAIKRGIILGLSEAQLHQKAYITARANANAKFVKKMEALDADIMRSTLEERTGGHFLEEILGHYDLRSTAEAADPQGEYRCANELDDLMLKYFPN